MAERIEPEGGCLPSEQSRTAADRRGRYADPASQQAYLLRAALEEPIYVVGELKPILVELRGWGRNLNQLTVLAHTGRVQTVYLRKCMEVLGKTYEAVNRLLTEKGGVISRWRRVALSRRVSRPSAPWAGCSVTLPGEKDGGSRWAEYLSGINCGAEVAQQSFMATKNLYSKASGTFFYHYVQSSLRRKT